MEKDGLTKVEVKYLYRYDPHETFKAENSNIEEAKRRTDALIRKLKKENKLEGFQEQINSKKDIGTLRVVVNNENSESTSSRLINDTLTANKKGASFSLENKVCNSNIGDSFQSLVNFRLY